MTLSFTSSYSAGFFQDVTPNFESLIGSVKQNQSTTQCIPKDYFPENGTIIANEAYKLTIRDMAVLKKERGEYSHLPIQNSTIDQIVEWELKQRDKLRKEVRTFAVERLHFHYRLAFDAIYQGTPTLNSFDEILSWIDGQFRGAKCQQDKDSMLSVVGRIIYTYFAHNPRWEFIEETDFMQKQKIAYQPSKGKGCIAKCIVNEKAEQNKRFQNILNRYGMYISSKKDKHELQLMEEHDKQRGDFYKATGKKSRKKTDPSSARSVDYTLISNKTFPSLDEQNTGFLPCRTDLLGVDKDVSTLHQSNSYIITVTKLFSEKISAVTKFQDDNLRSFWLQKIIKVLQEIPAPDEKPTYKANMKTDIVTRTTNIDATQTILEDDQSAAFKKMLNQLHSDSNEETSCEDSDEECRKMNSLSKEEANAIRKATLWELLHSKQNHIDRSPDNKPLVNNSFVYSEDLLTEVSSLFR